MRCCSMVTLEGMISHSCTGAKGGYVKIIAVRTSIFQAQSSH